MNNLRANVLSEFIKNHVMLCYAKELHCSYQSGLSTLHLDKKHLRSVIVFLDVTVNQVGSQEFVLGNSQRLSREERLENMFVLFRNASVRMHVRVHPSKTL